MEKTYKVPMWESERGWGSKIDGYAGPFSTLQEAVNYQNEFNDRFIDDDLPTPDWYIMALTPVECRREGGDHCTYGTIVPDKKLG